MAHKLTNKSIAKKVSYFIADLEYNEVSDPMALADLLEDFLNGIIPDNAFSSTNLINNNNTKNS